MAQTNSHREASVSAPADQSFSPTVDGHGSDKGRQPSSVRPMCVHRLAGTELERRDRGERIADQIRLWVIVSSTVFMVVVLLWMATDAFLDRTLG